MISGARKEIKESIAKPILLERNFDDRIRRKRDEIFKGATAIKAFKIVDESPEKDEKISSYNGSPMKKNRFYRITS